MSLYKHFTTEEREMSMVLKEKGYKNCEIAQRIGKSESAVSREFSRNSNKDGSYSAHTADEKYKERRKNCGKKPILQTNDEARAYVTEHLEQSWSPEQIAGRAKLEGKKFSISLRTIYRGIENGTLEKRYKVFLRIKRVKNRKRRPDDKRGKIADTTSIHERPEAVNKRLEAGHWESDTVIGKRGTGCIGTHVERKSGYLKAFKMADKTSEAFTLGTIAIFEHMPEKLKKSFTVDNGREFYLHRKLSEKTGMIVYFCDPHCPWQRGSNENTNGLIRQYFPKKSSFADITDERLAEVVDLINNRPRKRLGFLTPAEVINDFLFF